MSSAGFVFLPSAFILIASPTAMQNLPHRRRSDAGVQAASHAQAAPAGSKPIDATERPTASSKPCNNSADTLSDDTSTPSDCSTSSSLNRPLTASFIIQDIQARLSGRASGNEWKTYQITSSEWDNLRRLLECSGDWDKLRYAQTLTTSWTVANTKILLHRLDYYIDTQTLVHRMPSRKHDHVTTQITILLHTKLKQLCHQDQVKCPFKMLGSADVKDHRNLLQPDSSIYHVDARVPVLVLEVGVSQSAKSLEEKAKAWIRTGGGKIRYVFTLKLDGDSQAVYLTTWTPEFVHEGQSTVLKAKGTYQVCYRST
jgi:hypothetical protein